MNIQKSFVITKLMRRNVIGQSKDWLLLNDSLKIAQHPGRQYLSVCNSGMGPGGSQERSSSLTNSSDDGSVLNSFNIKYLQLQSLVVAFNYKQMELYCGNRKRFDSSQFRGIRTSGSIEYAKTDKHQDEVLSRGDKILKVKLATTRLDAVIKAGLGMSRNKIEKVLYDDRVRVNGQRPSKKSVTLYEGDEVDIVRGYNKLNPNFIDVSRIEILDVGDDDDNEDSSDVDSGDESSKTPATLKRSKSLTIKNYPSPWKGNSMDD